MTESCLQCGRELLEPFEECHHCGLVQSKHRPFERRSSRLVLASVDPEGRRALLLGGAIAVVLYLFPFTRFVFSYLLILIHELGHAATSWIFATPALPALDFVYGGGFTFHGERSVVVAAAILAGWLWAIVAARGRPRLRLVVVAGAVSWILVLLTPLRELLVIAMGHGAELVVAAIFFYRAISGRSLRSAAERPAYAFSATFLTLSQVHFASQLLDSAFFRRQYEIAKGGHRMDFTRLAEDFFRVDLEWIAAVFFLASFAPPIVGWLLACRWRR